MIALFVLKLMCGITLMWQFMPRKEVTDGFFRIQMRLLLGLAVLAALMLSASTTFPPTDASSTKFDHATEWIRGLCIAAAVLSYAGSVFWALGRRLPGNLIVSTLALLCSAALIIHSWNVPNTCSIIVQLLSDLSSSLVAGAVLTGMLLGHWYLTTPTMSIQPLWWFNRAIVVAAMLRLVGSSWTLIQFGLPSDDVTQQMWLSMRWFGGVLTPVIVAVLVWRILKLRNTQSATGVLFAGLILVFMGEMTAALLERQTGLPY